MFVPVDVIFQEIHGDTSWAGNSASKYGPHVLASHNGAFRERVVCAVGRELLVIAHPHLASAAEGSCPHRSVLAASSSEPPNERGLAGRKSELVAASREAT
jgi:hypothetical protein